MRRASLVLVLCTLMPMFALISGPSIAAAGPLRAIPVVDPVTGLWDYGTMPNGKRVLSHGPDPLTEAIETPPAGGAGGVETQTVRPFPGFGRANALQCHPSSEANLYETIYYAPLGYPQNQPASYFRDNVVEISGRTAAEAFTENDTAGLPAYVTQRFVTDANCMPVIQVIRGTQPGRDFSSIVNDLAGNFGKNRSDRKYLIYAEGYTAACGQGTVNSDSRKIPGNANNTGPDWSVINMGCSTGATSLHEIGHNLGAVQTNSPYANGFFHCIDESDVMCYAEHNVPTIDVCVDGRNWWDCNHNDYFHPNPPAGTYLATHWNMASDSNWQDRIDVTLPWVDDLVVEDESDYALPDLRVRLTGELKDNWATKSLYLGVTGMLNPIPNGCPASGYGGILEGYYIFNNTQSFQGEDFASVLDLSATQRGCYELSLRAVDLAGNERTIRVQTALGVDIQAPVARFTTPDGTTLIVPPAGVDAAGELAAVAGTVTDSSTGTESVSVRFTMIDGPLAGRTYSRVASLSCVDANRRNCAWTARAPSTPGRFRVTTFSRDPAGNYAVGATSINVTVV